MNVTREAFSAVLKVDTDILSKLSEREVRALLPCLVRMALCRPLDGSSEWTKKRKQVLKILAGIEVINSLVGLLSIDFHALDVDIKKEQMLRQKIGGGKVTDSILVQSLEKGLAIEFEQSDSPRKLRLVLSEILAVFNVNGVPEVSPSLKSSDLFDNEIYFDEVSDVLCIAQAEISSLLSLPSISEGLLNFKYGPELICRLVSNSPDSFTEVFTSLILNGPKQSDENECDLRREKVLKLLCQINPLQALVVRSFAVENCRMPGLAIALTLDDCKQDDLASHTIKSDLIAFVSGLLLGSDSQVRMWFSHFVRANQKQTMTEGSGSMLEALRHKLLEMLKKVAPAEDDGQHMPECHVVQASALLKLYCALKGIAGLKFGEEETSMLLQVLTSHPPHSRAGVHFVSIGLCLLIACPSLIGTTEHERKAIAWIRWLIQEQAHFESNCGASASFGEMLLLLAIHFHSDQIMAITDLICSTLGMKIAIRTNNLTRIKNIFTHDIFTEKVVTSHAVRVPVTPNLSAIMQGFLPIHCIYQLLKSRAFSKHQVPIKNWIYKQICNVSRPLHPVLPLLIEVYVTSVIVPSSSVKAAIVQTNQPISDSEILAMFQGSISSLSSTKKSKWRAPLTSQLLMLYYLMLYEDCRLAHMKTIVSYGHKVKCYSDELLSELPIKYLLQEAQKEQHNYAGLFAPLLKLLATHYPHLCLPQGWIRELESHSNEFIIHSSNKYPTLAQLQQAFEKITESPGKLILLLDEMLTMPANHLWKFSNCIVSRLPLLLVDDTPRQIINKVQKIWWKFNSVMPRRLWVMTVQVLQAPTENGRQLRQDDIVLDPLNVLRCDKRVFRCPPLFEIVLHMLKAFLAASFTYLSRHILNNPITSDQIKMNISGTNVDSDNDREELKVALVAAQESAAVQILLETCLLTENEKNITNLSNIREVQCLVCSHLHQVFISEPSLAKLVHFQGYPSELIPMAVAGIPSMHICLDFIPELLSQPHVDKQIFGIELISHLCLKYAIPKSISIARLSVQVLSTLLSVLPSEKHTSILVPTLPALVRICQAFPPLADEVISLLLQLGRIAASLNSLDGNTSPKNTTDLTNISSVSKIEELKNLQLNSQIGKMIEDTFAELCRKVVLNNSVY